MQYLYPVWFFFAAVFSYLAYVHWRQSNTTIRHFFTRGLEDSKAQDPETFSVLAKFIADFNKYLEMVNASNKTMNRNAAVGYFVAAAVSVLALFLSAIVL
ncbi:MAG TPA: hypothetical protein VLL77_09300 [Anaerolineales bacterium]|nr:hypothetical protein [Anaerolineales bacterium]